MEHLDAAADVVGHGHGPAGAECDIHGLPGPAGPFPPPPIRPELVGRRAVRMEHLDAMPPPVGHGDCPAGPKSTPPRPPNPPGPCPRPSDPGWRPSVPLACGAGGGRWNTWTRELRVSVTAMTPPGPNATLAGCQGRYGLLACHSNLYANVPVGWNTMTRLRPMSATATTPPGPNATSLGAHWLYGERSGPTAGGQNPSGAHPCGPNR